MENPEHLKFIRRGLRQVVVDDVLLHRKASAAGQEVVSSHADVRMVPEMIERAEDACTVGSPPFLAPRSPSVEKDRRDVPFGIFGESDGGLTARHLDLEARHGGIVPQLAVPFRPSVLA